MQLNDTKTNGQWYTHPEFINQGAPNVTTLCTQEVASLSRSKVLCSITNPCTGKTNCRDELYFDYPIENKATTIFQ